MVNISKEKELKFTEIGYIPIDWKIENFGDMIEILRGGSPRPINDFITKSNDGLNWIKIGDAKPGAKYIISTKEKIKKEGLTKTRYVHENELILSNSMSFGRPYILKTDGCIHDGWLVLKNYHDNFEVDFLYYYLSSNKIIEQYKRKASGSGVLNLNKDLVSSVKLIIPPKREQKQIATVLSDTDKLIESLEKLIEKKKNIKQGTMQHLLNGKKRLEGYTSKIEGKQLGDIVDISRGKIITENNAVPGNIPVIAGGQKPSYYHNRANRKGKTITISGSGAYAGFVNYFEKPIFASDCSTISEGKNFCIEYIYYQLALKQSEIYNMQTGGAQPHVHPRDLRPLKLSIPDINEQKAIAKILLDMDNEIEALENKLEKYKQIKQGMMQELLTGRIRLV